MRGIIDCRCLNSRDGGIEGEWIGDFRFQISNFKFQISDFEFQIWDLGFGISELGLRSGIRGRGWRGE